MCVINYENPASNTPTVQCPIDTLPTFLPSYYIFGNFFFLIKSLSTVPLSLISSHSESWELGHMVQAWATIHKDEGDQESSGVSEG